MKSKTYSQNVSINKSQQAKKYSVGGEYLTLREMSEIYNIPVATIVSRLKSGRSAEEAVQKKGKKTFCIKGKWLTYEQIIETYCVSYPTFLNGLKQGLSPDEIIEKIIYKRSLMAQSTNNSSSDCFAKNESYTIENVTKPFLEWCNLYNIRPEIVRSRMSMGSGLHEALTMAGSGNDRLFNIDGEIRTLQHWSRLFAINHVTARNRIKRGWNICAAFKEPVNQAFGENHRLYYRVDGKDYTLGELSAKFNINQVVIKHRLRAGIPAEDAVKLKLKKVRISNLYELCTVDGVTATLKKHCENKGIAITTALYKLEKGVSVEDILTIQNKQCETLYDFMGKKMTLKEISEYCNISYGHLRKKVVNKNIPLGEAVKTFQPRKYHIDGEYLTMTEISQKYAIHQDTIKGRLEHGLSLEEAVKKPLKRAQTYYIHGKLLTGKQIENVYGITSAAFRKWIKQGATPEEAIEKIKQNKNHDYIRNRSKRHMHKGQMLTINEISKDTGIPINTLYARIRNGLSIDK